MEGPSNGGLLYHEVQESKLCAVHCVNTLLQGPFFSEFDLAALASDLDNTERQMMADTGTGTVAGAGTGDFSLEASHNVSLGGDFSIQELSGGEVICCVCVEGSIVFLDMSQVLEKALGVWDLQVIPLNSPAAEASKYEPELENAFICHLHDHWFCIRKVNGEWYNFNSLYPAPEHLSKFYLSAFLDTLKGSGWSIFLVRGSFPKDCTISLSAFGQWLTPEDAARITKSCNETLVPLQRQNRSSQFINEADAIAAQEERDLNAAIAASLMDSSAVGAQSGVTKSSSNLMEDPKTSAFSTAGGIEDEGSAAGSAAVGSLSGVEESAGKSIEDPSAAMADGMMDPSAFRTGAAIGNAVGTAAVGSQAGAAESSVNLMDHQTDRTGTGEPKDINSADAAR